MRLAPFARQLPFHRGLEHRRPVAFQLGFGISQFGDAGFQLREGFFEFGDDAFLFGKWWKGNFKSLDCLTEVRLAVRPTISFC